MAKPYVFAGYGNYKLALDAAYAHFDKDEQAYAGGEDFSSVTVDDVLANERLLTFFKTRYFGKQGKGVPSPSLFRALADRNRAMVEWLPAPVRLGLPDGQRGGLAVESQFPAVAVLQDRPLDEIEHQFAEALARPGMNKTKAFGEVLRSCPVRGIVTGVDLETTWGGPARGYIINAGWEQMEMAYGASAQIAHSWYAGLPQWYAITGIPFAQVHHIGWPDLEGQPPFRENKQVQEELLTALTAHPYMAHNAAFEDSWLTLHLDGYAEAKVAGKIKIIDSMYIASALYATSEVEETKESQGGDLSKKVRKPRVSHSLDAWAHRLGVLTDDESEKHLGLDDTDLMLRCAFAEFARNNLLK